MFMLQRRKARALFDNRSECADELAFRRGELLTVLSPDRSPPQGWWLCSLRGRQVSGTHRHANRRQGGGG